MVHERFNVGSLAIDAVHDLRPEDARNLCPEPGAPGYPEAYMLHHDSVQNLFLGGKWLSQTRLIGATGDRASG